MSFSTQTKFKHPVLVIQMPELRSTVEAAENALIDTQARLQSLAVTEQHPASHSDNPVQDPIAPHSLSSDAGAAAEQVPLPVFVAFAYNSLACRNGISASHTTTKHSNALSCNVRSFENN